MGNFKKDLEIGEYVQDYLIKKLAKEFGKLKASEGDFSDYDLISEDGYTFEVKFDRSSEFSRNTAIEFCYKGKPSGIANTKAIEWIQVLHSGTSWVYCRIMVDTLKAYLKSNWDYLKFVQGGDKKQSALILIDKDIFLEDFMFYPIRPAG